jgi:hypothetical protein
MGMMTPLYKTNVDPETHPSVCGRLRETTDDELHQRNLGGTSHTKRRQQPRHGEIVLPRQCGRTILLEVIVLTTSWINKHGITRVNNTHNVCRTEEYQVLKGCTIVG